MKRNITYIIITLLLLFILFPYNYKKEINNEFKTSMQKSIATKVLRFHVIGNSNSDFDQSIKLDIKSAIVDYLNPILDNVMSIEQARETVRKHLPNINKIANSTLEDANVNYNSSSYISTKYFPEKAYGDLTLPAGEYEAVCINLGRAKGRNWWCMLYPSLCFIDCTYSILPDSSKDKLKTSLTSTEYNYVMNAPDSSIKYESALLKLLKEYIPFLK